ncbi:hypothetical protein LINGRAHAP2_LOCUS9300 [Linum grandiflorum]
MDSLNANNLKTLKAKAVKKHKKFQKITKLLRALEILVFLAVVSSCSIQLPAALKNLGEYFKDFLIILASPRFVFVVGNVIVVVLFVNSGQLSGSCKKEEKGKGSSTKKPDIYEEFMELSGKGGGQQTFASSVKRIEAAAAEEEVKYRGKPSQSLVVVKEEEHHPVSSGIVKSYERSKSEKLTIRKPEKELRRSVTEKLSKKKGLFPEDDMSNEEFKSAIDAFIERQKRFRKDEQEVSVFVA